MTHDAQIRARHIFISIYSATVAVLTMWGAV